MPANRPKRTDQENVNKEEFKKEICDDSTRILNNHFANMELETLDADWDVVYSSESESQPLLKRERRREKKSSRNPDEKTRATEDVTKYGAIFKNTLLRLTFQNK